LRGQCIRLYASPADPLSVSHCSNVYTGRGAVGRPGERQATVCTAVAGRRAGRLAMRGNEQGHFLIEVRTKRCAIGWVDGFFCMTGHSPATVPHAQEWLYSIRARFRLLRCWTAAAGTAAWGSGFVESSEMIFSAWNHHRRPTPLQGSRSRGVTAAPGMAARAAEVAAVDAALEEQGATAGEAQ
jgi:hypothetical protein